MRLARMLVFPLLGAAEEISGVVVPRTRSTSVTAGCIVPTLRKPRRMGHPQLGYREETKTEGQATRLQPLPRRAT
jgi:hypothetical protein